MSSWCGTQLRTGKLYLRDKGLVQVDPKALQLKAQNYTNQSTG